jgi:hypothetical protein
MAELDVMLDLVSYAFMWSAKIPESTSHAQRWILFRNVVCMHFVYIHLFMAQVVPGFLPSALVSCSRVLPCNRVRWLEKMLPL